MDFNQLPIGLGMGLAMNAKAMENYGKLTEQEKEEVLLRCKDIKSKSDMEAIINSISYGIADGIVSQDRFL